MLIVLYPFSNKLFLSIHKTFPINLEPYIFLFIGFQRVKRRLFLCFSAHFSPKGRQQNKKVWQLLARVWQQNKKVRQLFEKGRQQNKKVRQPLEKVRQQNKKVRQPFEKGRQQNKK